jgi:hypothetical protein
VKLIFTGLQLQRSRLCERKGYQLNKLRLLSGCGRLLRNGLPMAKVEGYEIYINQDERGKSLTFGWMRVPGLTIPSVISFLNWKATPTQLQYHLTKRLKASFTSKLRAKFLARCSRNLRLPVSKFSCQKGYGP